MFAIDDEKLPPPNPAVAAHASSSQNCAPALWCSSQPLGTTTASSTVGISSKAALMAVHLLPPNLGTAKVYGRRSMEPTRFGTAVSQNCWGKESLIPTLPRLITTIVHSTQTLKPMCSANTDKTRFFRASDLPVRSQNSSSSGSH